MKKQNARIAKELIKIAKDLMAVNVDENFSDLTWVAINKILNETEFLQALNDYITIKESIVSALTGTIQQAQNSKTKLAGLFSNYAKFKNLNSNELDMKIDEMIENARSKMPNGGVHQDVNNNIYFQRYIESLIEIKRRFILYKTKGSGLQVTTVKNARGLMSRIAEILNNDALNFLTGNPGQQYQQISELTNLESLLQARGMKLTNQDSKQFGDKNISDKIIDKVNQNDLRPRLKQASEQMRKFISQNQQSIKDISNQRFYITKINDKVTGNFNTTIGFFTSINTLLLNWLSDVRRKEGLMDIQHDIPQSDSAQLEMAQELKINPNKLKTILQKLKEIQNPGVSIDEAKNFLKVVASKFNVDENELQNELNIFLNEHPRIKKKINENNLRILFNQILSKFQDIDQSFLQDYVERLKQGTNMKQFKKKDLESLFEDKDFANLTTEEKKVIFNYLNNNRSTLYDDRELRIASRLAFEAGIWDNIKGFFSNIIRKGKEFLVSIKDKFNNMIASLIPQEEIETDMNALDEETKRVTLLMQEMESIDNELGSLFNTLSSI